ncbi:DNA recombination protein RmuC [Erythrobacter sp. CCH5-A1]|jgi:DNA recombination protein RmuC|uniref:DNA recombination protein RmuC n=1 Tax=Erythrobacter sp. CCH5-A1 TaxID=1768792 RepID=UPI00082F2099|nr:DNA recombination protein RmuC [Erythrobacter sp. CCH5-A1]
MDPAILSIIALLAGAALGWFFASRPLADLRARLAATEAAGAEGEAKFARAIAELGEARIEVAGLKERAAQADGLLARLDSVQADRAALAEKLAALESAAAEREKAFAEQKSALLAAQDSLRKEFENAGSRVLEQAQKAFLERADARFQESEKTSAERLKSLLAPVDQRLRSYEEQVQLLEKQRVDAFGQLLGQIDALRVGQEAVRVEALRLGNSLRNAPKARGRWGEQQLQNVLEQCGLTEHTDFVTEHSIDTDDGRLRPDAIVRIPGNKQLVIDAKVSLNAYQDAFEAEDEEARKAYLDAHSASMRNHIQTLGTKSYQSQFDNAPDYVIMFVPGEHFIAAALEHDSTLWDFAFKNKVLLASPTNLVAIARTIAQVWQQEGLAREAREIGKLAATLYDSLAKTQDDLMKTGVHLGRAVNSFNDFARTYEGNVMSRARRLTEKHIQIGKREISDEVPLVEVSPRFSKADAEDVVALEAPDMEGESEKRDAAE